MLGIRCLCLIKCIKSGNQDKAIELLDDLALNILYDESNQNADPFWEKTSADYFSGVALGLFEDAKEDEININSISLATTVGEEKFGGSTYIKEYFAQLKIQLVLRQLMLLVRLWLLRRPRVPFYPYLSRK